MVNDASNGDLEFVAFLDRNWRRQQSVSTKRLSVCTKIHGVFWANFVGRVFNRAAF